MLMDVDEYITDRLNEQIGWYDQKSKCNKKWFYLFKVIQIVSTSLVPTLIGSLLKFHWLIYVISALSLLALVCEGLLNLYDFHDNWVQYRNTAESLKHEKFMFLSNSGAYDNTDLDSFKTLVERTESLVSSENVNWANMNLNYKENTDHGKS